MRGRLFRRLLVIALFLAGASAQAANSLGGVTISNVNVNLRDMTIRYTITNTTDKALNGWGVKIGSFCGVDAAWSSYYSDHASAGPNDNVDGVIEPGGHRDLVERLQKVSARRGEEFAYDTVDPTSGDVVIYIAIFEDNRAFGPAKKLDDIEKIRSSFLALNLEELQIIDHAKQAADPRAYLQSLMDNLPKPKESPHSEDFMPGDKPRSVEEANANWRLMFLHSFLQQTYDNLANSGTNSLVSLLDTMATFPAAAKARLERHTKLIRVEAQ